MSQKVAYVTGGMGGIGTAICQRLHKEGFTVIAGCGPTRDFKGVALYPEHVYEAILADLNAMNASAMGCAPMPDSETEVLKTSI